MDERKDQKWILEKPLMDWSKVTLHFQVNAILMGAGPALMKKS